MSNSPKPSVNDVLTGIMRQMGPGLLTKDYIAAYIAQGRPKPSGAAITRARREVFGVVPSETHGGDRRSKKRKYARREKLNSLKTTGFPLTMSTLPPEKKDEVPEVSDKTKYDLIQVKETAALVGGLDRLVTLATWLKNWQV